MPDLHAQGKINQLRLPCQSIYIRLGLLATSTYRDLVGVGALMGASICCFKSPMGNGDSDERSQESLECATYDLTTPKNKYVMVPGTRSTYPDPWGVDPRFSVSRRGARSLSSQLTTILEESNADSPCRKQEKTLSTRTASYGSLTGMSSSRCRTISSSDDDAFFQESFGSMKNYQRFVNRYYHTSA